MGADFTTTGTEAIAALGAALARAGLELVDLESANTQAGRVVLEAARPPHRSGRLAASSRADATRNGVTFASTARYWTFVHWGAPRRHITARPWFVQALAANRERVVAVYADHAADTLKKV